MGVLKVVIPPSARSSLRVFFFFAKTSSDDVESAVDCKVVVESYETRSESSDDAPVLPKSPIPEPLVDARLLVTENPSTEVTDAKTKTAATAATMDAIERFFILINLLSIQRKISTKT